MLPNYRLSAKPLNKDDALFQEVKQKLDYLAANHYEHYEQIIRDKTQTQVTAADRKVPLASYLRCE